ncbi:MAG: hypothetical protein OXU20_12860 [Myxococcales bacterium]|nr:hypothetical protein [Myxococcales bacterium]
MSRLLAVPTCTLATVVLAVAQPHLARGQAIDAPPEPASLTDAPGTGEPESALGAAVAADPAEAEPSEMPPGVLTLFQRGLRQLGEERWSAARDTFAAARTVWDRPNVVFNLALSLYHGAELLAAEQTFEEFERMAEPTNPNRSEAARLRALAAEGIAELILLVAPPEAALFIDGARREETGARRPLRLDPGNHQLRLETAGHIPLEVSLRLTPGHEGQRRFELEPIVTAADSPPDEPFPLGPAILAGGGGTLLLTALVAGAVTNNKEGELEDQCVELQCDPELRPTKSSGKGWQVATNVLLALGSAAAIGGGIWWWLASRQGKQDEQQASVGCSPDGCHAVVRGQF